MKSSYKIFVPGRICLLGEHSDWIVNYKRYSKKNLKGKNIVALLNQGITAIVTKDEKFVIEENEKKFEIEFNKEKLYNYSQSLNFYSYACGTLYQVSKKCNIGGLNIKIISNELPISKGLSSSAAICVLIVKALNNIYNLNLSDSEIMDLAYLGERMCGSKCGRMDQIRCLQKGIYYVNISDKVSYERIYNDKDIYLVYSDLNSSKNTKVILDSLNKIYPYAKTKKEKLAHNFLEVKNQRLVEKAKKYIQKGDARGLARIMNTFQQGFDKYISPFCPEELEAPILHQLMKNEEIKKLCLAAKGVGSQGDGSIQFVVQDKQKQLELIKLLKEYGFDAKSLTISKQKKIKKAFIAAAGQANRLYPYTKVINKEFMPLVDKNVLKPTISILLEELYDSGIKKIYIGVSSKFQKSLYINYFNTIKKNESYDSKLKKIFKCLKFVLIKKSKGFGDSVYHFKKYVDKEPFLLLLGDTIYKSKSKISCIKQLIDCYENFNNNVVGIEKVAIDEASNYGICFGNKKNNNIIKLENIKEKPSLTYLKKISKNKKIYKLFGNYILTPKFFEYLANDLKIKQKNEIHITNSLSKIIENDLLYGCLIDGISYDVGNIKSYKQSFNSF